MRRQRTTDLQIRGIPVTLRERLRERASAKGLSMSQYVTDMLKADLATPSLDEWLDELKTLPKIDPSAIDAASLIREEREERTEELARRTSS